MAGRVSGSVRKRFSRRSTLKAKSKSGSARTRDQGEFTTEKLLRETVTRGLDAVKQACCCSVVLTAVSGQLPVLVLVVGQSVSQGGASHLSSLGICFFVN